jgi:ABC-type multidrug transport system fused ATPase/permease subunit
MAHLEDPSLTSDATMARDFDLGITGPPLSIAMDFIAAGLVEMIAGLASAAVLIGYAWWAPLLLAGAWLATHWLLRESAVWRDRNTEEVRAAQRDADYTYRLAVEPAPAKEVRLFGLADWVIGQFRARRLRLFDLRWHATRLRERPLGGSLVVVLGANLILFYSMASAAAAGRLQLDQLVTYASAAVTTGMIAFGGLSWALDCGAAPVGAVLRLREPMARTGALVRGSRPATGMPAREIRFRNLTFSYPAAPAPVLDGFDLTIPAGSSLAIVGLNGAGKTTLAKLLCRLYDPQAGAIEVDGVDLREIELDAWRSRIAAVFQDFIRFELPLRDNVAPAGAPEDVIRDAVVEAGASGLADLDTVLARGYQGGTDLSGGQWQRVALARALCAVRMGAALVLLDEPTAQLDVRGEMEIFDRILAATRHTTTILISHRFSTVRHADRICVLEHGRVVELGSHDELMASGGRYRTMFDLQASRFGAAEPEEEGVQYDVLN